MKVHQSNGYYVPAAFWLHVETERPIDQLVNTPHERTLTHELVHFLQDVSTTYGLANICRYVEQLKCFSELVRGASVLSVPIVASQRSDAVNANTDLFSFYSGDGADKYMTHNDSVVVTALRESMDPVEHVGDPIFWAEIEYGCSRNFHFGSIAIMESMAHIIECEIYGRMPTKSFPYDSAQLVMAYLCPDIEVDALGVLEVCEASLMFLNPAEIFIRAARKLNADRIKHTAPNDYYKFVMERFSCENQTAIEYFENVNRVAQGQLDDLFTVAPFCNERWGSGVVRGGFSIRTVGQSISSRLFESSDSSRDRFYSLISDVGFPPSFNNHNQVWVQSGSENTFTHLMYPAISSISEMLEGRDQACCLYDYCKNEQNGYRVNQHCLDAPWKRAKAEEACYYSHIWKMWGHGGCEISQG
jgi:hypothetical protein